MKLYVIRHGESEGNREAVFSGWFQHNLTEKGREDARKAGEILSGIPFDKVYSSDLYRAIDTAKIALPHLECEATPLIKELNVGIIQGMTYSEAREKYGPLYRKPGGNDYSEIGGESREDIQKRLIKFLSIVESSPYENVAAFCHGGVMRNFLKLIVGKDTDVNKFDCGNCCIAVFEYKNGNWILKHWNI